jgi:hypothetical protein
MSVIGISVFVQFGSGLLNCPTMSVRARTTVVTSTEHSSITIEW